MTTEATINRIFESFTGKKILIIGDVMLDAYYMGKVDRISPEAPVPIVSVTKKDRRPGGAANVAFNVNALGGIPVLCAVRGNDPEGEWLEQHLRNCEMDVEGLKVDASRPTTVKTRIIGNNQQVLRVDEETTNPLSVEMEQSVLGFVRDKIGEIDAIVFEDYNKGLLTSYLIREVLRLARKQNVPTLVDPKKEHFDEYHGVTLFKPNRKEIIEGLKIDSDLSDRESVQSALQQLAEHLQVQNILLTLSQQGVAIYSEGQTEFYPAHQRKILDVSGAGDSVISVAALCAAISLDWSTTARLSNLAGGLVCEKLGVVPIDRDVLLEEAISSLG
ncbi:MAG: D-glycero-beta-D-manno-heptose-7-phosphate kinase [Bacteroidetes bacterium]|nr:D-glycero-beta-D-manno-heptose-7-phosphate kinase [Bacteroidota bacterium]